MFIKVFSVIMCEGNYVLVIVINLYRLNFEISKGNTLY